MLHYIPNTSYANSKFHLIMSIALPKKYAIIQVGKRITSLHE